MRRITFYLAVVLTIVSAQSVVDDLKDVWATAGGSSNFYVGNDPCNLTDFVGVTCNQGTVTQLSISGSTLNGKISPSIGRLINLTSLSISSTQLNGHIPSTIGQLKSLTYLKLSSNNFSGPLPSSLGSLHDLQAIDVSYNGLNGTIDVLQNCTSLTRVTMGVNSFSGEIPPFIFNSSITYAILSYNKFTFPSNVDFSSPSKLIYVSLAGLGLYGLPSYLYGNLTNVITLSIDQNNIGSLRDDFASAFPNVTYLNLGYNDLNTIPSLLTMKKLIKIELYNNYNLESFDTLLEKLPPSISYLNLDKTNINGTLDRISSRLPYLNFLSMSSTKLSGDLQGLCPLHNLTTLNMNAAFGGSTEDRGLPSCFGSLLRLTTLSLKSQNTRSKSSSNLLKGYVPLYLCAYWFPSLTYIDLSNNSFYFLERTALIGFQSFCSVLNNSFSCFSARPTNSVCMLNDDSVCPLIGLYDPNISIYPRDAQSILDHYNAADQSVDIISAVITALLRTAYGSFSYSSNTTSISLQTYDKRVNGTDTIQNEIVEQNCSVSLPLTSVSAYDRGRVVGVQVYDERGREVEIGGVTEKINITMGYIDIPSDHTAVCQWWNETQKGWSRDGCDLYIDETRLAVCQCNHLTNFSIGVMAATRSIPADGGGMTSKTLIIIICCAAGGSILVLSLIISFIIIQKRQRMTKSEVEMDLNQGEEMKGRVKMERKEREEEGIETWKAVCDGVTAVSVMKAVNARGKTELTREAVMLQRQHHPMIVMYLGKDST
ncbi:hypothetical protein PROFUN_15033, partial [Planoprotostelium fungivorum]